MWIGRVRQRFIFKYSKRKGTPAAEMEHQLPDSVKEARNHDLLELVNSWAKRRCEPFVGREVEILCEGSEQNKPSASRVEHAAIRSWFLKVHLVTSEPDEDPGRSFDRLLFVRRACGSGVQELQESRSCRIGGLAAPQLLNRGKPGRLTYLFTTITRLNSATPELL